MTRLAEILSIAAIAAPFASLDVVRADIQVDPPIRDTPNTFFTQVESVPLNEDIIGELVIIGTYIAVRKLSIDIDRAEAKELKEDALDLQADTGNDQIMTEALA
jgi:hypothetical protein